MTLKIAETIRRMRALPADTVISCRTHGLDICDKPRSRCILYYDRRQMEAYFSDPAFDLLRNDPAYSLRFAISCSVFCEVQQ